LKKFFKGLKQKGDIFIGNKNIFNPSFNIYFLCALIRDKPSLILITNATSGLKEEKNNSLSRYIRHF